MEKRDILIANNRDQSKYRVVTNATTLGQLQDAILSNQEVYKMVGNTWVSNDQPIDIYGLTFTEGITKTQLLTRESVLPTNVNFKGNITNNLVMLLTNTNKQIRSGAYPTNRKEFGDYIKKNNLGGKIKQSFGDNWTRVSTDKLLNFFATQDEQIKDITTKTGENKKKLNEIREKLSIGKISKSATKAPVQTVLKTTTLPDIKEAPHAQTVEWFYEGIKCMVADKLFYAEDVVVIANLATELAAQLLEAKSDISISDIDNILDDLHF